MVKVGVLFPAVFEDPGDYLADARALETAGVDSLWTFASTSGDVLLGAITAVTTRVRLGLLVENPTEATAIASRVETLRRLSRSRTLVGTVKRGIVEVATPREEWAIVAAPADRSAWQKTLVTHAGLAGVIVPQDPRLLDILRRPMEEDDRTDLLLTQG
jgi:alkanesulfonate monooxygenase SsuD/methylene tetrahydromethanopterin reductase-like flavin-dependent oxidoreductase (luciferase family)